MLYDLALRKPVQDFENFSRSTPPSDVGRHIFLHVVESFELKVSGAWGIKGSDSDTVLLEGMVMVDRKR